MFEEIRAVNASRRCWWLGTSLDLIGHGDLSFSLALSCLSTSGKEFPHLAITYLDSVWGLSMPIQGCIYCRRTG